MLSIVELQTEVVREEPTLFIHGFMGSGSEWQSVAEAFGGPVWALDLPGHGHSVGLMDEEYGFLRVLDLIVSGLESKGIDRVNLVGYSMGGRIALALALTARHRVRRLILESTSPGIRTPTARVERQALDRQRAENLRTDFDRFLGDWYEMPIFASLREDPDRLESVIRHRMEGDPEEYARALVGLGTGTQPDYWGEISDLEVETTLIVGSRDAKYVEIAREMESRSVRMQQIIVPEAGHNVHLECPNAYLQVLNEKLL